MRSVRWYLFRAQLKHSGLSIMNRGYWRVITESMVLSGRWQGGGLLVHYLVWLLKKGSKGLGGRPNPRGWTLGVFSMSSQWCALYQSYDVVPTGACFALGDCRSCPMRHVSHSGPQPVHYGAVQIVWPQARIALDLSMEYLILARRKRLGSHVLTRVWVSTACLRTRKMLIWCVFSIEYGHTSNASFDTVFIHT